MNCTACGNPLPDGAAFCTACGAPVPKAPVDTVICPSCGKVLPARVAFCTGCGTRIQPAAPAPTVAEPSMPVAEPSTPVDEPSTPVAEPSRPVAEPSRPVFAPFPAADMIDPEKTAPSPVCIACGAPLKAGAAYCRVCGTSQVFTPELMEAAKAGDQDALAELYNRTYNGIYYALLTFLKNEDAARDILRDSYAKAFARLNTLQDSSRFTGWLKRIALNNACVSLCKKKPTLFSEMADDGNAPDPESVEVNDGYQPEEAPDEQENKRLLWEIINSLSDEQRMVVSLFYFQEMSVADIAAEFGLSEGTIKCCLNYARKIIEGKVLELERQGTKLYGMAPLTFLLWLLAQNQMVSPALPGIPPLVAGAAPVGAADAAAGDNVIAFSEGAAAATASANAIGMPPSMAGAAAAGAAAEGAGFAATTAAAATTTKKSAGLGLGAKIGIVALALAVAAGGCGAAILAVRGGFNGFGKPAAESTAAPEPAAPSSDTATAEPDTATADSAPAAESIDSAASTAAANIDKDSTVADSAATATVAVDNGIHVSEAHVTDDSGKALYDFYFDTDNRLSTLITGENGRTLTLSYDSTGHYIPGDEQPQLLFYANGAVSMAFFQDYHKDDTVGENGWYADSWVLARFNPDGSLIGWQSYQDVPQGFGYAVAVRPTYERNAAGKVLSAVVSADAGQGFNVATVYDTAQPATVGTSPYELDTVQYLGALEGRTTTADGSLVLRAAPNSGSEKIGAIPGNTDIDVIGKSTATDEWLFVQTYSQTLFAYEYGWVNAAYLNASSLPYDEPIEY